MDAYDMLAAALLDMIDEAFEKREGRLSLSLAAERPARFERKRRRQITKPVKRFRHIVWL